MNGLGPWGGGAQTGNGAPSEVLKGSSIITLPNGRGALEWVETVAAIGVVATDAIFGIFAPGVDADENTADMLEPSGQPVVVAGANQITVSVAFREPTSGPIAILWKVF